MEPSVLPTNTNYSLVEPTKPDATAPEGDIKPCETSQGNQVSRELEPLPAVEGVPVSKRKTTHCVALSDKGKKETSVASAAGDKVGVSDTSASLGALTTQIQTLSLSGQDSTNDANSTLAAPEPALDKNACHGTFEFNRLHKALLDKDDESVETLERLLLQDKMDPNARCPFPPKAAVNSNTHGCTPLFMISLSLDNEAGLKKAELLLRYGAKPDAPIFNRGVTETLLTHMVQFSHAGDFSQNEKLIRLLCTYGADLEKEDKHGDTPLGLAITCEKVPMINLLLDLGAKVDASRGAHYLNLAIVLDMPEIFLRLLSYDGVDPKESEKLASYALGFAIANTANHDMDLITPLVEKQVDLNRRDEGQPSSALLRTLMDRRNLGHGRFKAAALLIAHGAQLELWEELSDESKQWVTEEKFSDFEDYVTAVESSVESWGQVFLFE